MIRYENGCLQFAKADFMQICKKDYPLYKEKGWDILANPQLPAKPWWSMYDMSDGKYPIWIMRVVE